VSGIGPVHPSLAPLAREAKAYADATWTTGLAPDRMLAALREAVGANHGWLRAEHRVGDPARSMRHLLYVDPGDRFVITAITWLPGQKSPVHGHYVWCAYGVVEGELTEETFRAGTVLEALGTRTIHAGELAELDLGGPIFHRVSNRAAKPLVTLHAYGVASYNLTTGINRIVGEE
jgi:predicted metal-dependent enzyme (double-stranded beta helix superfamily)